MKLFSQNLDLPQDFCWNLGSVSDETSTITFYGIFSQKMCKLCVRWEFEVMLHHWNASIAKRILSKKWLFVKTANTKWTLWSGHGRRKCFSKMLFVTATVPGFTFSTICCPRRRRKTFWINIFQEIFHVANFQEKICRKSCEISDQILFRQYCIA